MDSIALGDLRPQSRRSSALASTSASPSGLRQPFTHTPARFLNHPRAPAIPSSSSTSFSANPSISTHKSYEPTSADHPYRSLESEQLLSRTTTLVNEPLAQSRPIPRSKIPVPHTPVPATKVFSRGSPPLHLPELDEYLSTIPLPNFFAQPHVSGQMFPPMQQLADTNMTIDDLQHNSTIPAKWKSRTSLLQASVGGVLGLTGSSLLTTYYSLTGVVNTVQIFALLISTLIPYDTASLSEYWRTLLLGTIPNVLALNFASGVLPSLIFLLVFMSLAGILLYWFHRSMSLCERYKVVEGLHSASRPSQWGAVIATFLLTLIYLPLSTISIRVLVWSQDLWVVDNPYINATSLPPDLPPLGPENEYRNPLDFCWTTTMRKNEVNFAPLAIVASALTFAFLTIWYPVALLQAIKQSIPRVNKYNALGRPRSKVDMEHEYESMLDRDLSPFAFLYVGFRREMGYYQPIYLWIKLSTLVIVAVFSADNCLFRNASRSTISIVSQTGLFLFTVFLWIMHSLFYPFLDPVNNASEWVTRMNFVLTSGITLAVACNAPGSEILSGYVLWVVYAFTYLLTFYFLIINIPFIQTLIKRWSHRVDFSVDVFSPRLDLSSSSVHIRRRIWQESISTLLLTDKQCKIPEKQAMDFAESRDSSYPPYLLNFTGSPGERHVENLKILSEIGSPTYRRHINLLNGPDNHHYQHVSNTIQHYFVGPDSYWQPPEKEIPNCRKYWGNSWWVPFPPCLVFRYDDGPLLVLSELRELEEFVRQNRRSDIQTARQVRLALRALEGQRVYWPYEHTTPIGSQSSVWCCRRRGYSARTTTYMDRGILKIKRRGLVEWKGFKFGSGFDVELNYKKKGVTIRGNELGITEDFDLTTPLARFLGLNEHIITSRLPSVEEAITDYRDHLWKECRCKMETLSYGFLVIVYDHPREPADLASSAMAMEEDLRVRSLLLSSEAAFRASYIRCQAVSRSPATAWWYIFWDDFWRRNHEAYPALSTYEQDFNPHFPSSIAYRPLPRAALCSFLSQRGLMSKSRNSRSVFHHGLINKLYFRLNEAAFHTPSRAITVHLGKGDSEYTLSHADMELLPGDSSLGTGGGTDYDDDMRPRPEYRWEGLLSDPIRTSAGRKSILAKTKAWFGLSPVWRASPPSRGLALDLRLENGRYVLLQS